MDNDYVIVIDGELYHHGTKGMKWGRRLYQNRDGSLTALGKKRYLNSDGTLNNRGKKMRKEEADALKAREAAVKKRESEARQKARQDAKKAELDARERALDSGKVPKSTKAAQKAAAAETKSMKDMTDAEIKAAISRKQLEDQYRQAFPEQIPKGKQIADKFLNEAIIPAAIKGGKDLLEKSIDKIAKKALADKVNPNSIEGLTKIKEKLALQKSIKELREGTVDERTKEYTLSRKKAEDAREDAAYTAGAENRRLKRLKERLGLEDDVTKIENDRKEAAATAAQEKANKKREKHRAKEEAKKAKQDAKDAARKAKEDAVQEKKRKEEMDKYNEYQDAYKKSIDIDAPNTSYHSKGGERTRTGKAVIAGLLGSPSDNNTSSTRSNSNVGETSTALISKIRTMTNGGSKTYAEIANQLGISVSTVQNYSRGRDTAYELLDRNGSSVMQYD